MSTPLAPDGRNPDQLRRLLLRGGLTGAAGVLASGCAGPPIERLPDQPLPPAQVRIGDLWRYERIDGYNGRRLGEIVAQIEETAPRLRVALRDSDGRRVGDELYEQPWTVIQEPFYDAVQIFTEPVPLLPPSGRTGDARWHYASWREPGYDLRYRWDVRNLADGWERLRVPAGEFVTLRVTREIALSHPDFKRLRPWRRETLWYAPAIERWAQREWTGWFYWPGERFVMREDFVRWRLIEHRPQPRG